MSHWRKRVPNLRHMEIASLIYPNFKQTINNSTEKFKNEFAALMTNDDYKMFSGYLSYCTHTLMLSHANQTETFSTSI